MIYPSTWLEIDFDERPLTWNARLIEQANDDRDGHRRDRPEDFRVKGKCNLSYRRKLNPLFWHDNNNRKTADYIMNWNILDEIQEIMETLYYLDQ